MVNNLAKLLYQPDWFVKEINCDANVLECRLHIWNNGYFVWTQTYFSQINLWFVSEPYFCIGNENNGKNDRANL